MTSHRTSETQERRAGHAAVSPNPGLRTHDAQKCPAGVGEFTPPAAATAHQAIETHRPPGGAGRQNDPPDTRQSCCEAQSVRAGDGWIVLRTLAEMFYDAQKTRIALSNRVTSGTVWPAPVADAIDAAKVTEAKLGLAMRKAFRTTNPDIHTWVTDTPGIGEHLMARLVGAIGDPYIATPHHWEGEGSNRVLIADPAYTRTVSQLWAYCGIGDPTRRRHKGMTADEAAGLGNPHAKMLCRLIAEGAMKCAGSETRARSPYRDVYDEARSIYETDRDWTPGHCHNAALRKTAKAIVRDLWVVARSAHLGHYRLDDRIDRAGVGAPSTKDVA